MSDFKVAVCGYGHVGTIMTKLFRDSIYCIYDEPKNFGRREKVNECDFAFICVPTPQALDGHCDTSIVEDLLSWVEADTIIIRSTVPVGFTDEWRIKTGKHIVFQPEYYGETISHPFADPHNRSWITLGGCPVDTERVVRLYQTVFTSDIIINQVDAKTAELAKYMENCFYATKVTFCNEFYDIANAMGVDYNKLRETWLLDPRISRSHTFVYPDNRGYGGSCLPKDMAAMIYQAEENEVDVTLLDAVRNKNTMIKWENRNDR